MATNHLHKDSDRLIESYWLVGLVGTCTKFVGQWWVHHHACLFAKSSRGCRYQPRTLLHTDWLRDMHLISSSVWHPMDYQTHLFSAYRWLHPGTTSWILTHLWFSSFIPGTESHNVTRLPLNSDTAFIVQTDLKGEVKTTTTSLQCSLFACPFRASNFLMCTCQHCRSRPSVLHISGRILWSLYLFFRGHHPLLQLFQPQSTHVPSVGPKVMKSWTPVQPSKCLKPFKKC